MENDEFEKVQVRHRTCYYFDDIIKSENVDMDNILIDKKLHKNIFNYSISYKTLIGVKPANYIR